MRVGILLPSRVTRPVFSDYHSRHMDMQFLDHNWSNPIRVFSSLFRWRQVEGQFIRYPRYFERTRGNLAAIM